MREKPGVADDALMAVMHAHYGLSITSLTFLPIGNDSDSAVYRIRISGGVSYFLKLRSATGFSLPSLFVPHFLHDHGVPHIVAPLPTISGALWVDVHGFALSLYPFIEARTGMEVGLSDQEWCTLGATIRQVHSFRRMWIVDWDETVLALKERDLMFVSGGIVRGMVGPRDTECFLQGYGETAIDPYALSYYRYAWAVQDMAAYGERVFFTPGLSAASRREALEGFKILFAPGNIVEIARASDSPAGLNSFL